MLNLRKKNNPWSLNEERRNVKDYEKRFKCHPQAWGNRFQTEEV